ncbi:phosphoribosylglycinamide synthetase [Neisseria dentiae]|uniref:phosphoribosylglycinamide synthetase n=1 Tax=Neisseria dentiae TaxID=194197 RepID=UPI00359FF227
MIREPVAAQSQPAQAIQTKTFGEYTIHLMKAKVVGQILSVEFIAVPPKDANGEYKGVSGEYFPLKDFDYIDETTSKKVTLLQDENGKYMANPLSGASEELWLEGHQRFPQALTLKFPAPPETSSTITIDFPKIGSFESVPLSR